MGELSHRDSGNAAIRFDRNEWSGAFGDIGTDMPLIVGLILVGGLEAAGVLVMFGVMQVLAGLYYRMPMPVQPLKAMAVIVITQNMSGGVLYGGGIAIGLTVLLLTSTGLMETIARTIPKCVVRGIQLGLGLKLASLALSDYVTADGALGYGVAGIAFLIVVFLLRNRKCPPALPIMVLGIAFTLIFRLNSSALRAGVGFALPSVQIPSLANVATGFVLLALPQLPLSIGNSILATRQITEDLFPERTVSIRKLGFTYSIMNLVAPLFGGIPACHGSGGVAGHYTFGGRTGGSVIVYGAFYVIAGMFFSGAFREMVGAFPLPVFGVILLFEGLALMLLARDTAHSRPDFSVALIVGLIAFALPYGYVVGVAIGTLLAYLIRNRMTGLAEHTGSKNWRCRDVGSS